VVVPAGSQALRPVEKLASRE